MTSQEVRVKLRRRDISMAEQLLDHAKVGPTIEEMRCKRVTKGVGMDLAPKTRAVRGGTNRAPRRLASHACAALREEERLGCRFSTGSPGA